LVAILALACEPPPTEELLAITFGAGAKAPPVELDVDCEDGGCMGLVELEVQLTFETHEYSTIEAMVKIVQYRVDYHVGAPYDDLEVPYFSGNTSVALAIGDTTSFNIVVAGDTQREFLRPRIGERQAEGRATLTLAGYDHNDELVMPAADFDIFFDDYFSGVY